MGESLPLQLHVLEATHLGNMVMVAPTIFNQERKSFWVVVSLWTGLGSLLQEPLGSEHTVGTLGKGSCYFLCSVYTVSYINTRGAPAGEQPWHTAAPLLMVEVCLGSGSPAAQHGVKPAAVSVRASSQTPVETTWSTVGSVGLHHFCSKERYDHYLSAEREESKSQVFSE